MSLYVVNLDPLNTLDSSKPASLDLSGAWLLPVVMIAALFIGYLCFDAWRVRQRNKRINRMREKARETQDEANPS
jgi:hypothetical protein